MNQTPGPSQQISKAILHSKSQSCENILPQTKMKGDTSIFETVTKNVLLNLKKDKEYIDQKIIMFKLEQIRNKQMVNKLKRNKYQEP